MKTKINWLEWSKEAFEKARKENKSILLDLTAVWCHWCHVMDETSYSDSEIAEIINKDFVPIKVYIDKNPDIRERYNFGGFPSTVFLNHDGCIMAGYTYVPPERLKVLLNSMKNTYKEKRAYADKNTPEFTERIKEEKPNIKNEINEGIIKEIMLSIEDNFDAFYGGFGMQPKFPSPETLDLLFVQYSKTKNKKYLDMALKTLDCMHEGIYDKLDYGFFRYSVARDWKMPHYEKMLETNAGLLRNYAVAFNITKDEKYKNTAIETLEYINKFLSDQNGGGFYGSQDADEEFYNLKPEERKNKMQPYVDKTIYADWNSMMISSYIKAGAILNDDAAIEFAIKTVDFILKNCYGGENGVFHYFDGYPHINGLLSDNIYFLNCLIDMYFITQNPEYFKKIKELAAFILGNFYDNKNHGFFDRVAKEEDLGILKHRNKHFLENSFSAIVFLRLYFLAKEERCRQAAENTLLRFAGSYMEFNHFAAVYSSAVDMLLNNEIKVDIVSKKEMVRTCIGANNPRVTVNFIDKNKADAGYEAEGAYICKGNVCKGPIKDNAKLEEGLSG